MAMLGDFFPNLPSTIPFTTLCDLRSCLRAARWTSSDFKSEDATIRARAVSQRPDTH